ncbi:helix-turn-helix transcriptional regulator [Patulibacter sp. NPDC049589]|uniref:helix-turn-helix domain-containing protein n=1 Tax=Patulibacter sp. NPDC049589 TaxID=3154731 RepID=UPI003412A622
MRYPIRSGDDLTRTLQAERRRRGLTQHDVGELTGLDQTYLSRLETDGAALQLARVVSALRRLGATIEVRFDDGGPADVAPAGAPEAAGDARVDDTDG